MFSSPPEIERVRALLVRAPEDRAWRRRSWLVMMRSRVLRATSSGRDAGVRGSCHSNAAHMNAREFGGYVRFQQQPSSFPANEAPTYLEAFRNPPDLVRVLDVCFHGLKMLKHSEIYIHTTFPSTSITYTSRHALNR